MTFHPDDIRAARAEAIPRLLAVIEHVQKAISDKPATVPMQRKP